MKTLLNYVGSGEYGLNSSRPCETPILYFCFELCVVYIHHERRSKVTSGAIIFAVPLAMGRIYELMHI